MGLFDKILRKVFNTDNIFKYEGGIPIPDDVDKAQKFIFNIILFSINKYGADSILFLIVCMDDKVLFIVDDYNNIPESCEYFFPLDNSFLVKSIIPVIKQMNDINDIGGIIYRILPEIITGLKINKFPH